MSETKDGPFAANAAEAARLVREVQDLGFEAAQTIVGRFCELFGQFAAGNGGAGAAARPGGGGSSGSGGSGGGSGSPFGFWGSDRSRQALQADMQRAADSYMAIMGQMNEAGLRFLDATRWWQQAPSTEQSDLRLPDVAPGGRVSARLWLHNTTAAPAANLRPWCPGLSSPGGASLPTNTVTCGPERIERLEPDASVEVLVTAAVEDAAAPGLYHGQLLVDGLPDVTFPLRLVVLAPPNAP